MEVIGGATVAEPNGSDPHPSWVVPFWMLMALAGMFVLGCGCGSVLTTLSMLGPLGPD